MTASDSRPGDFPIISLQPVTDGQQCWAALLLTLHPAAAWAALPALFDEFGLHQALAGLPCIVPLAHPQAMTNELARSLPASDIVLLVPLACCADAAAAAELERLQRLGFRLMAQGLPDPAHALSGAVTALACDVAAGVPAALARLSQSLPGPQLALGVDSPALFEAALAAGCSRFVGGYPFHPAPAQPQQGPARALLLKLLGLVTGDGDSHAIEELLKQTPALSYQLLKLVNSVGYAQTRTTRIANFGHAIALLGRRQLQRWLQLLLYAQSAQAAQPGGVPHYPLMARAARRASLAEALCRAQGGERAAQERAFMVGMFSLLDTLFAMPLEDIVTPLNLAEDVVDALLRRGGPLGPLLALIEQAEQEPGPALGERLAAAALSPEDYARSLVTACRWALQVDQGA